ALSAPAEPPTGLPSGDVAAPLGVLRRLVEAGNTLVVIEHPLDVIAATDWVIDLGPEGGEAGGRLVAAGTPADVAACPASVTGRFLRERLSPPHAPAAGAGGGRRGAKTPLANRACPGAPAGGAPTPTPTP